MSRDVGAAGPSQLRSARLRRWAPVFVGAAVVRAAYWSLVTPGWRPDADADQYVRLSRTIAAGDGFGLVYPQLELHPTAFRPPVYPYLLAPLDWLPGDPLWPYRLLNLVIGSLVVVLAGVLAARIAGRTAGLAASAAVALYPPLLANDTVTLTEPLALLLLLVAVLLVDEDRWLPAGLALGVLLLTRPNGYLVVAVLAAWCATRLGVRRAGALAGTALLVMVPWLVRNQVQVGTWHPTTSDGFTLAAVYAPPGQVAGHFVDPVLSPAYDDADHRFAQFDEADWNERLTDEALDGLRDHPRYVRHVVEQNVDGYFELDPDLNRYPERVDGRSWDFRQATRPLFFVVTAAGLVGLALTWRDRRVVVLAALAAQFVAVSLVLVAPPRLRAPFDLVACIGVGLLVGRSAARRTGDEPDTRPPDDRARVSPA